MVCEEEVLNFGICHTTITIYIYICDIKKDIHLNYKIYVTLQASFAGCQRMANFRHWGRDFSWRPGGGPIYSL